jgi:uncharacterized membrane protein
MIGTDASSAPIERTDGQLPPDAYARMTLVLRIGLLVSIAVSVAAIVAYLLANPGATFASIVSSNPILQYLTASGLGHGLATGSIPAYLTLGMLVLVATPLLRVLTGMYYFHRGGEREMTAVTIAVLVLLLVGILVIGPLVR